MTARPGGCTRTTSAIAPDLRFRGPGGSGRNLPAATRVEMGVTTLMPNTRNVRSTRRLLAAGILFGTLAGGLAGCGSADDSSSSASPTSSPRIPTHDPSSASPSGPSLPKPTGPVQTRQGKIEAGVEPGCVLLKATDKKVYLLVGGNSKILTPGAPVVVKGYPQPDLMSTCQQGEPFQVTEARRS